MPRRTGHMLRRTFVTTMLDAGVSLRDVEIAARRADPSTTMRYHRARNNLDRHPSHILAAYMTSRDMTSSRLCRDECVSRDVKTAPMVPEASCGGAGQEAGSPEQLPRAAKVTANGSPAPIASASVRLSTDVALCRRGDQESAGRAGGAPGLSTTGTRYSTSD